MRYLRLFGLLLFSLGAAGCWDVIEVDRRGFVASIGLDAVTGPGVRVVAQFALTQHLLPSTTGLEPQRKRFFTLDAVSRTVLGGLSSLQTETPHAIDIGQVRSIIIQDDLARKGVKRYMDYILRSPKLPPRAALFVSRDPTQQLLRRIPVQFVLPGFALGAQIQESPKQDQAHPMPLWAFAQRLDEEDQDPFAPVVFFDERNEALVASGLAAFRHDRLAGLLDGEQTRMFGLLTGRLKNGYLEIPIGSDRSVAYRVVEANSVIRALNPDLTRFSVDIRITGNLGEYPDMPWGMKIRDLALIEQRTAKHLRDRSQELIHLLQSWESDILGFGQAARISHPHQFRPKEWRSQYSKAKVDVRVHFRVIRLGLYD